MLGQYGPYRSAKHDAESDLACLRAQGTRDEMLHRLRKLKDRGGDQPAAGVDQISGGGDQDQSSSDSNSSRTVGRLEGTNEI